jgi:selenocysteine lyase/cysteine desulfurase
VLGNILPVREISKLAHSKNVFVFVDASQTAGVLPIDVAQDGIDFMAFTGHKGLLGPTGTGGFYMRGGMKLDTLKEGGTGSMAKSSYQPELPPDRFEAGTINVFGLAGLKAAVDFINETGVAEIFAHERRLAALLMEGLRELSGVEIYGSVNPEEKIGIVCFNLGGADPYEVASDLDKNFGIMVRAGLHCAPPAHRVLGTGERGAIRVSVGFFNTESHIDELLSSLKIICDRRNKIVYR